MNSYLNQNFTVREYGFAPGTVNSENQEKYAGMVASSKLQFTVNNFKPCFLPNMVDFPLIIVYLGLPAWVPFSPTTALCKLATS